MNILQEWINYEMIKSPMLWIGGKYKLLKDLIHYLPQDIDTFVDLFCGGCDVGINVKANRVVFNDKTPDTIKLYKLLKTKDFKEVDDRIRFNIAKYGLPMDSKTSFNAAYRELRANYNENKDPLDFLTLIFYSYNNESRFNLKGEFNTPAGNKSRYYNLKLQDKLSKFMFRIKNIKCQFENKDFAELHIPDGSFIYADPPYLLADATYNRQWRSADFDRLTQRLDYLSAKGHKFALSESLELKGNRHDRLDQWVKVRGYRMEVLNHQYNNCNAGRVSKYDNKEVLVMNY